MMPFVSVDVDALRWSHNTIYDHFTDGTSVFETVVQLVLGERRVTDLPPLQVVKRGRELYSISNRRLFALKTYARILKQFGLHYENLKVSVEFCEPPSGRAFTTKNGGLDIDLERPRRGPVFAPPPAGPREVPSGRSLSRDARAHSRSLSRDARAISCGRSASRGRDMFTAGAYPASSSRAFSPGRVRRATLGSVDIIGDDPHYDSVSVEDYAKSEAYAIQLKSLAEKAYLEGNIERAGEHYEEALQILSDRFDKSTLLMDSLGYVSILNSLAEILQQQFNNERAAGLYERSLKIQSVALSVQHPHYKATLHLYEQLKSKQSIAGDARGGNSANKTETANRNSKADAVPLARSTAPGKRSTAEVELVSLLQKWLTAYMQLPKCRRSAPSAVKQLLPKVAPKSANPLLNGDSHNAKSVLDEIASWMEGSSGCSLGPHNQIQTNIKSMRTLVGQVESQLDAISRVGPMLPDGYRSGHDKRRTM